LRNRHVGLRRLPSSAAPAQGSYKVFHLHNWGPTGATHRHPTARRSTTALLSEPRCLLRVGDAATLTGHELRHQQRQQLGRYLPLWQQPPYPIQKGHVAKPFAD
jgi:hypothetical protein